MMGRGLLGIEDPDNPTIQFVASSMGAGELGLNLFHEVPETIRIIRRAYRDPALRKALFGDGAVNHGAFHESVNFAGIQNAPVVFVCENNLYATATPLSMTTRNVDIASKAAAYGVPGVAVGWPLRRSGDGARRTVLGAGAPCSVRVTRTVGLPR